VKATFNVYRVLATVVGISIIILIFVALPLNELHRVNPAWIPIGSGAQQVGDKINLYLGTAHGFIYIAFVFVAFALSRMARWSLPFTIVSLICGTIPFLSFWAELRAIRLTEAVLAAREASPATASAR
jgi:integral membrane protein